MNKSKNKNLNKIENGFKYIDFNFPIDWEYKQLQNLYHIRGGRPIPRGNMGDEGTPCLHYGDIHSSNKLFVDISEEYNNMPKINKNMFSNSDLLPDGSIVFADASEDYEGIGKSVVIENNNDLPIVGGLHTIVAIPNNKIIDKKFSRYVFSSWFVRKQMMFFAQGISVYGISRKNIGELSICLPPINEQEKIAEILSSWDDKINGLIKLIDAQEIYREAVVKSLITNYYNQKLIKKEYKHLKHYLNSKNERVLDRNIEPVAVGIHGIRLRSEVYDKELSDDYSNNKVIRENDLCFGIGTNNIVYDVLLEDKVYCVSPAYKVYEIDKIDAFYLKSYLDTFNGYYSKKYMIISSRQGKSVDMKGLLNEKIYAPSYEEQLKFSKVIHTIDNYIDLLKEELKAFKLQKQGLMQQLLTGKIRVNTD